MEKEYLVAVKGWNEGFQKVSSTKLIQETFGLNLKESKSYTDLVVNGDTVTFTFSSSEEMEIFKEKIRGMGAIIVNN